MCANIQKNSVKKIIVFVAATNICSNYKVFIHKIDIFFLIFVNVSSCSKMMILHSGRNKKLSTGNNYVIFWWLRSLFNIAFTIIVDSYKSIKIEVVEPVPRLVHFVSRGG